MKITPFLAVLAVLVLGSCTSPKPTPVDTSALNQTIDTHNLVMPEGLEPQVAFWRNVYGVWSRRQVALHDARHMALIYNVITLPGPIDKGYTAEQKALVRGSQSYLQDQLKILERKTLSGEPLTVGEKQLADQITQVAGTQAIIGAGERLRSQRGLRERFKRGLEISGRYNTLFRTIFRNAGLPEDLAYLPHVESSFQLNARSSAGAAGVWQFTRGAAKTYMSTHPALDLRLDPVAAARGAARYLRDAYDTLGHWPLALTSYNHGIGGMKRAKARHGNDFMSIVHYYDGRYFGFASRNFYAEFLAAREVASDPQRFFPEGIVYEPPLNWDRVVLNYSILAPELAAQYDVGLYQLIDMNMAWTAAARNGKIPLPVGTEVWLPAGTLQRLAADSTGTGLAMAGKPATAMP